MGRRLRKSGENLNLITAKNQELATRQQPKPVEKNLPAKTSRKRTKSKPEPDTNQTA